MTDFVSVSREPSAPALQMPENKLSTWVKENDET